MVSITTYFRHCYPSIILKIKRPESHYRELIINYGERGGGGGVVSPSPETPLKGWKPYAPPSKWLKLKYTVLKLPQNILYPPFSMTTPPSPICIGLKLVVPPLPFCCPPPPHPNLP